MYRKVTDKSFFLWIRLHRELYTTFPEDGSRSSSIIRFLMVLMLGPKEEEVVGSWRRPHNEELHNLYATPNVTRVIKLRRMRWVQHVAHMGGMRNAYKIRLDASGSV
jgi:hypothetical protein